MSKSLKRVKSALAEFGVSVEVAEMPSQTRTAQEAADAAGCHIDQIAKSIIFQGTQSGELYLFVTAGGNQVDPERAAALTGEPLKRADAQTIRDVTGFAIGGVAPIGHLAAIPCFFDPRLLDFDMIWAAAGTPRHIFPINAHLLSEKIHAQVSVFT